MDTSEQYKGSIVNPLEPLGKVERVKWYEDPIYIKMSDTPEIQDKFKAMDRGDLPVFAYDTQIGCTGILFWTPDTLAQKLKQFGNTLWVSIESRKDRKFYSAEAEGKFSDLKIWLPRQDELQKMLGDVPRFDTSIHSITLAYNFAKFCGIYDEDSEGSSNIHIRKGSMEQLWLGFVMKTLHEKVWDGSKWVARS